MSLEKKRIDLNLGKGVTNVDELGLGCRIRELPSIYLGLPLGAPFKSISVWDGAKERFHRRPLIWKKQYILKEGEIHVDSKHLI